MRVLLAEGADVDQRARGGQTALMVAAIFCRVDIARLLLAAGADVRLQDNLGLTAMEWADRRGSSEVAQLLASAARAELVPSPKNAPAKQVQPKVEAESRNSASEAKTTPQQHALSGTEEQLKTDRQRREVEEARSAEPERRASATETVSAAQRDALRWTKFHKRIMAEQKRRRVEDAHREADESATVLSEQGADREPQAGSLLGVMDATWSSTGATLREAKEELQPSLIETKIAPQQNAPIVADEQRTTKPEPSEAPREADATRLSEQASEGGPQVDSPLGVVDETWSSTGATLREAEEAPHTSPIETKIALQQDAPIVADEQQTTKPEPSEAHGEAVGPLLSEHAADLSLQAGSALGVMDETWSSGATLREPDQAPQASPIETKIPYQQDASGVADDRQTPMAEPAPREAKEARPTATQSARIAATIEHLGFLEEPLQGVEGEVRATSPGTTRTAVKPGHRGVPSEPERASRPSIFAAVPYPLGWDVDPSERDPTRESRPAEVSTRPAMLEPKPSESLNPPPIKRCPKCNAAYENPRLTYCAYDGTKLVSGDVSLVISSAANDWSRQTLWALVAIIAVLGASLGYLINNYRSREKASPAPIAATVVPPESPRKDVPLIDGELSGTEVNVPEPEYPAQAKAEGVSGSVKVRVQVNKKGRVTSARSSGGDWRLRAAAVEAARKATFSPEKLAAHGGVVSGTITYNFVTQTESPAATASPAPTQTNSPSANGPSSATESSSTNVSGDYPVVGGALVGAESNLPHPDYPERAKSKGIHGSITVVVRVNRAGKVISWRTSHGDSQLRAAALKAAKKATFSPEKLAGSGEVVGTITYNFNP